MMKTELELADILKSESLETMCRICLKQNAGALSLYHAHETIPPAVKVLLCTRVQMSEGDGLPGRMCEACSAELTAADSFRVKCELSDSLLKKICYNLPNTQKVLKQNYGLAKFPLDADFKDDVALLNVCEASMGKWKEDGKEGELLLEVAIKPEFAGYESDDSDRMKEELSYVVDREAEIQQDAVMVKQFTCHICSKALTTRTTLKQHIANLHSLNRAPLTRKGPEKRFHCSDCAYKTTCKTYLKVHMRQHTGERPYQCDVCSKRFIQLTTLISHKKTHSDKMYYTCSECGKQFKHKRVLEKHKLVHTKEKNYVCSICNKGLSTRKILDDHMKRHNNIRSFSCETCGAVFITKAELTIHTGRVHLKDNKYKCSICSYTSYTRQMLDLHVRRHTGDKTHQCEICGFADYTSHKLKTHMLKHTKERNYSCPECDKKFVYSTSVNKHMLQVHKIKYTWNNVADRRMIK